jgi:hypothetical protein
MHEIHISAADKEAAADKGANQLPISPELLS